MTSNKNEITSFIQNIGSKKILLWVAIFYGGRWLNSFFYALTQGSYIRYLFMDFANPFLLFILFGCLFWASSKDSQKKVHSLLAKQFLLVPLVFMLLEAIHFPDSYTIFTKSKYIFYPKIIANSLSMCFLLGIFELALKEIKSDEFFHVLVKLISLKAIIFMLISILAINRILPIEANEFLFNNSQAYESLTIILFLIFDKRISTNLPYRHFFLFLNALPMFIFQCRGAAFIFCFVFVIYLIRTVYRQIFFDQKKTLALMGIIFTMAIAYIAGYNAFGFVYGFFPTRDIYGRTQISHVVKLLSLVQNLFSQDKTISGIFLLKNYNFSLSDATISTYARIASIFMAFQHFLNYPIIGKGSYTAYALNIEGYGIHSLLPLILASYGLCGFLTFLLFCLNLIKESIKNNHNVFIIFTYSFYILMVMTFVNGFPWWYCLTIILIRYAPSSLEEQVKSQNDVLRETL